MKLYEVAALIASMSQITPPSIADPVDVDVDGEETVTLTAAEVRALRDALAEESARAEFYQRYA